MKAKQETVWKSLADSTRQRILDLLAEEPLTTGELCSHFKRFTRYGVMKHLTVLEKAGLVLTKREGRLKWHYMNAIPIQQVYDRWVSRYVGRHSRTLTELKNYTEKKSGK